MTYLFRADWYNKLGSEPSENSSSIFEKERCKLRDTNLNLRSKLQLWQKKLTPATLLSNFNPVIESSFRNRKQFSLRIHCIFFVKSSFRKSCWIEGTVLVKIAKKVRTCLGIACLIAIVEQKWLLNVNFMIDEFKK